MMHGPSPAAPAAPARADGGDQRHADGRRDAGAADHLHGHRAVARRRGARSTCPTAGPGALDQEHKPVQISLDTDGKIFVDEQQVAAERAWRELGADRRREREPGGPRIFLRADAALDYGRVMAVMGEINAAGPAQGRPGQRRRAREPR